MNQYTQEHFNKTLAKASQVEVFWCPLIRWGHWRKDWSEITTPGVCEVDGPAVLFEACEQLAGKDRLSGTHRQLVEDALNLGWVKSLPDALPESTSGFDRVVLVNRAVEGNHPLRKLLSMEPRALNLTFGLWENKGSVGDAADLQLPSWLPEINICAEYPAEQVRAIDFQACIHAFLKEMWQDSLYLLLKGGEHAEEAWLVWKNCEHLEFERQDPRHVWKLRTTSGLSWNQQLVIARQRLLDFYVTHRNELRSEMDQAKKGLGATLFCSAPDGSMLDIAISNRATFLFQSMFRPVIADSAVPAVVSADNVPILLEIEQNGTSRKVLYALYDDLTTIPDDCCRCVCGSHYPGAAKPLCPGRIVGLRSNARNWIAAHCKLPAHTIGRGWNWPLLSSPHAFFATDLSELTLERFRNKRTRQATESAERAAAAKAEAEWTTMMSGFFCSCSEPESSVCPSEVAPLCHRPLLTP